MVQHWPDSTHNNWRVLKNGQRASAQLADAPRVGTLAGIFPAYMAVFIVMVIQWTNNVGSN
jgi:hypothetical protein